MTFTVAGDPNNPNDDEHKTEDYLLVDLSMDWSVANTTCARAYALTHAYQHPLVHSASERYLQMRVYAILMIFVYPVGIPSICQRPQRPTFLSLCVGKGYKVNELIN